MGQTPDEVRRDIELTRERMAGTIDALEQKLDVKQMIADHPWPALAIAFGAGIALAGSKVDVKETVASASKLANELVSALGGLQAAVAAVPKAKNVPRAD